MSEDQNYIGKSVIDLGSNEIQRRFAKEAIGLAAVKLNAAYSEFPIDGMALAIPYQRLRQASRLLLEAEATLRDVDESDDVSFLFDDDTE